MWVEREEGGSPDQVPIHLSDGRKYLVSMEYLWKTSAVDTKALTQSANGYSCVVCSW